MSPTQTAPDIDPGVLASVRQSAEKARAAAPSVRQSSDDERDDALRSIADRLNSAADQILRANEGDVQSATAAGMSPGLLDRLRLSATRLDEMAEQVRSLAKLPPLDRVIARTTVSTGDVLEERRIPVGVIGANYEARANVTLDIATQFIRSGNAGVLRTGRAAGQTAQMMLDLAIRPSLESAGIDPDAIQLITANDRSAAYALVSLPGLVPLVILRGSGDTTRALAKAGSDLGVRTLAHADGGGTIYLHQQADRDKALGVITTSLDRLGVCNRLNLLLIDDEVWDGYSGPVREMLAQMDVEVSMPPHDHPLAHEWALDEAHEATVTVARVAGVDEALRVIDHETPGLAATILTEDHTTATTFLDRCSTAGAFWNVSTRMLDGFKLTGAPETGIAVNREPGPRGPVTYQDLCLRQYVLTQSGARPDNG
ncbi:MAG: aldehyde dehydrogenase family protein [Euzebya sp.]